MLLLLLLLLLKYYPEEKNVECLLLKQKWKNVPNRFWQRFAAYEDSWYTKNPNSYWQPIVYSESVNLYQRITQNGL